MKKIKEVLLFITVLVLLVGVVTAADVSNDTNDDAVTTPSTDIDTKETVQDTSTMTNKIQEKNIIDEAEINKKEDKNIKTATQTFTVNDCTQLRNALDSTEENVIININSDITLTSNPATRSAIKNLTINGNGKTINGNNQYQFLVVFRNQVATINNITITNGYSYFGGAVYNDGTLIITDSTLQNNYADEYAGAIYNYATSVTIANSIFTNNYAGYVGGALYNEEGSFTITNSTFSNNSAEIDGGALSSFGDVTIKDSTFTNNSANQEGGAINSYNTITITNSTLQHNTASNGAAIYSPGYINITNNTFKNNTATNNETMYVDVNYIIEVGDNIYESTDIALNEVKLSVKGNQNTFQQGDEVVLNYSLQLKNPNYYRDFENGVIVTLYINGQKNITTRYENITLTDLQPGEYSVYFTACNQQSNAVTFTVIGDEEVNVTSYRNLVRAISNATSQRYGVYKINLLRGNYNATQNITWTNSLTKKIIINGNGNILDGKKTYQFIKMTSGLDLTLENITLRNYTAYNGSVVFNDFGKLTITDSIILNNYGISDGGAILNNGTLIIKNSTFENNTGSYGGAISNGGTLIIEDSTFQNNSASSYGVIYNRGILTIINSTLQNNKAGYGGAVNSIGSLTIANSTFQNNEAYTYGGAIQIQYNSTIINSTFENNTAFNGGAIYSPDGMGIITINNSTLQNNTAEYNGGAIHTYTNLTITNSIIQNNNAAYNGSGIYTWANITIMNSTLQNNNANDSGGAIYNVRNLTIIDSTLQNNKAKRYGGAIYDVPVYYRPNIISSNFTNNTASSGAAIYSYYDYSMTTDTLKLTGNTFKENTATNTTETIDFNMIDYGEFEGNIYESTDIAFNSIRLSVKGNQNTFQQGDEVVLNYSIQLKNPNYYKDFENGVVVTLYINGQKNITTRYENISLTDLQPGEYSVYFTACNKKSNTVRLHIEEKELEMDVEAESVPKGDKTTITINLNGAITDGLMEVFINDDDVPIESITEFNDTTIIIADVETDNYNIGDNLITVKYSDSELYDDAMAECTLTLTSRDLAITVEAETVAKGDKTTIAITLNDTVTDGLLNVYINDEEVPIESIAYFDGTSIILTYVDTASYNIGENNVIVKYADSELFNDKQVTSTLVLTARGLSINLEASSVAKGDKTTVTINLNDSITDGIITVYINDEDNTIATITEFDSTTITISDVDTSNYNIGENTVTVKFTDSQTFEDSTTTATLTLYKRDVAITAGSINITMDVETTNLTVTFNDTVNDGTVNVLFNDRIIGSYIIEEDTASVDVIIYDTNVPTSPSTITVTYTDSQLYNDAIATTSITINKLPVGITIDPVTLKAGQTATITARITANDDNTPLNEGKVTFKVNGKTLKDANGKVIYVKVVDGVASVEYTAPANLTGQDINITAVYSGSTRYDKATANITTTVTKAAPTITTSDITAQKGETVTLTVTITDNDNTVNSGKVIFKINGKTVKDDSGKVIYASVVDGIATIPYTIPETMKSKNYTLTAIFTSPDYERVEDTKTLTVT